MGKWNPLLSWVGLYGGSQNSGAKKKYLELCQNFPDMERDEL